MYLQQNDEGLGKSIHNLVYCSRATPELKEDSIASIIASAQHHNPRFGITGILVYGSGIFFQWLEGPRDNVTSLMKLISADPRHSDVVLLQEGNEVRDRLFPDWGMELVEAADIRDVLVDAMQESKDKIQKQTLAAMLEELDTGSLKDLSRS
ncbi:BLUF domain-containing protein [Polynucleobacter antarcticus]|uniref:Blue light sensor protein n=1 Tax=Polynucleobacter antarcticus TaxID=1743162 RepID=A0A6M9PPK1_9BURK|nr:BLUF domain-containing protein [Polynucleobacter antarcticus]QKM62449.1 blue light sensor protein [Polynucleobacter antarcticus]